jgi:flagellum-specific peptidoglycan hydrolase FlgJ
MIAGVTHVDAFIAEIAHTAQAIGRKWKIPPSVIIAQAVLETGWGQAVKGNAYFGIKQGASAGGALAFTTHEVIDGQVVTRVDRFRTYRSLQDASNAYGQFLHETPRYKEALKTSDPAKFTEELQQAGYATDPH